MSWYRTGFYFTSKEGRLKIYKSKVKYKGRFRTENWYGRTFVDNKQLTKSSGTENKSKAKKILDDNAGKQIRENLNIRERDNFVWTKVRDRHLKSDVDALRSFIKSF